jgi:hypothetical protein
MAVGHTDENTVALVDTVTGTAFGPVFDSAGDVDDFLEWLQEQVQFGATLTNERGETKLYTDDPRWFSEKELEAVVTVWREVKDA